MVANISSDFHMHFPPAFLIRDFRFVHFVFCSQRTGENELRRYGLALRIGDRNSLAKQIRAALLFPRALAYKRSYGICGLNTMIVCTSPSS